MIKKPNFKDQFCKKKKNPLKHNKNNLTNIMPNKFYNQIFNLLFTFFLVQYYKKLTIQLCLNEFRLNVMEKELVAWKKSRLSKNNINDCLEFKKKHKLDGKAMVKSCLYQ